MYSTQKKINYEDEYGPKGSLTDEQIEEFQASFDLFKSTSEEGDFLNTKELEKVLRSLGIRLNNEELAQIIKETDVDGMNCYYFFLELYMYFFLR